MPLSAAKSKPICYAFHSCSRNGCGGKRAFLSKKSTLSRITGFSRVGASTGYGHTNNGSPAAALDQSFGYDNLNRLLSASLAGTSTLYSYDETGTHQGWIASCAGQCSNDLSTVGGLLVDNNRIENRSWPIAIGRNN